MVVDQHEDVNQNQDVDQDGVSTNSKLTARLRVALLVRELECAHCHLFFGCVGRQVQRPSSSCSARVLCAQIDVLPCLSDGVRISDLLRRKAATLDISMVIHARHWTFN